MPLVAPLLMQLGDHVGDQRAPARLVRSAESAAGITVVVFMEQDVVLEMRIGLHLLVAAEDGAASARRARPSEAGCSAGTYA